jgi:hypothetical protein
MHQQTHGIVPLIACCILPPNLRSGRILFWLLKGWMKEAGLFFSNTELVFTTRERLAEIKEQDHIWVMENWATFNPRLTPMQKKITKNNELRRLEVLKDERTAGGWWEDGVWIKGIVDGVVNDEGDLRWFELNFERMDKWVEGIYWV